MKIKRKPVFVTKLTDSEQWQEWAGQAQQGDKRAYSSLLKALHPFVKNVVYKSLSNPDAAEDIAQEVLISIHKSLSTYTPDRPFKPWLMSIVNFRKMDYLRKYYAQRQDMTSTTEDNPEYMSENVTNMAHAGELKDIETALAKFPQTQQDIFRKIKIEGYTAQEVANQLDMNESAVKVSAHRTMKKLQGMLK